MEHVKMEACNLIGISVKTSNENGQSAKDMAALWNAFLTENMGGKIPNKVDNAIYSVYTDYEGDYTKPYTAIIGCKVESLDTIPGGMVGKKIHGGKYMKMTTRGNLAEGVVQKAWGKIWDMDIPRAYTSDFEYYSEKETNPADMEVAIFIAAK